MISFLKNKGRPLTIFIFALVALIIFTLSTNLSSMIFNKWYGIIFGVILMIIAIPLHILGNKFKLSYVFSLLFNVIGMGACASAYYVTQNAPYNLALLFSATILPLGILLVAEIILTVNKDIKLPVLVVLAIIEVGLLIASIVFWVNRGGAFYDFFLFSIIIVGFFTGVSMVSIDEEERELLRDLSFGGFGAFFGVFLAVIIAISQGECCDGCDCGDCGDSKKSKTKKI